MTREEAKSCIGTIEMLQRLAYNIHGVMDVVDADNCKNIIKALEKEPCEDCICRQDVNDLVEELARVISDERCCISRGKRTIMQDILDLPSVTPKEKTAAWVPTDEEPHEVYECNACGWLLYDEDRTDFKYCPNCGARMVSE